MLKIEIVNSNIQVQCDVGGIPEGMAADRKVFGAADFPCSQN